LFFQVNYFPLSDFKASSKNIIWIVCFLMFPAAFQIHSGRISLARVYRLHVLKYLKPGFLG